MGQLISMLRDKSKGFAIVFLAMLVLGPALLLNRYRSGFNYVPLHVSLGDDASAKEFRVFAQSPFGTFGEFDSDPRYPGRWRTGVSIGGVQRVFVWTQQTGGLESRSYTVWAGESSKSAKELICSAAKTDSTLPDVDGGAVTELKVEPLASSRLHWPSQTINWQGDAMLILVPLVQAILLVLLAAVALFLRRPDGLNTDLSTTHSNLKSRAVFEKLLLSGLWLLAVVFFGQHLLESTNVFLSVRYADQFLASALIFVSLVIFIIVLTLIVSRIKTELSVNRFAFFVTGILFLAKAIWILQLDSVQPMDYGEYWKHGRAMAIGDYESIRQDPNPYKSAYVTRAYVYAFPVAALFGPTNAGLEIANWVTQLLSTIIFWRLGVRFLGVRAACLSVPFFVMYPDLWYSTTLMTHETPGMFWLLCVFWLGSELGQSCLGSTLEVSFSSLFRLALTAVAFGGALMMLDIQRSQGPFVIGGLLLSGVYRFLISKGFFSSGFCWRACVAPVGVVIVALTSAAAIKTTVRENVACIAGPMPALSTLASLTAVDAHTDAYPIHTVTWRFWYFGQIPNEEVMGFSVRKLAWEKLGVGLQFWRHLWDKNTEFSKVNWVMQWCFAGFGTIPGDSGWASWDIPHQSRKEFFCSFVYAVLTALMLGRLLRVQGIEFGKREIFPLCVCLAGVCILLLLTDGLAPYDIFLAIPLSWNAGVMCTSRKSGIKTDFGVSPTVRRSVLGVACVSVIVLAHLGIGSVINGLGWTFIDLSAISATDMRLGVGVAESLVGKSSVRQSIAFKGEGDGTVSGGSKIQREITIPAELVGSDICFFLSGDQRVKQVPVGEKLNWGAVPVSYKLSLDGEVVAQGQIVDLEHPRFLRLPVSSPKSGTDVVALSMRMEAIGDFRPENWKFPPAIAIEYVH